MRVFVLSPDHKDIILRGTKLTTILYDIRTKKAAYAVLAVNDPTDFRVYPIEQVFLMPKYQLDAFTDYNFGEYE
jgi:hypothetical protein